MATQYEIDQEHFKQRKKNMDKNMKNISEGIVSIAEKNKKKKDDEYKKKKKNIENEYGGMLA